MAERCPLCGGRMVEDEARGELVCEECGHVEAPLLDRRPEWRPYSPREEVRRARTGAPITFLLHDLGFSTSTPPEKSLKPSPADKNLIRALSQIHGLSAKLGLPGAAAETAAVIYRRARRLGLAGRRPEALATAALYLSSRVLGLPRRLSEFASATGLEEAALARLYRRLVKALKLKAPHDLPPHVSRLVAELGLSGEVERAALKLLEEACQAGLTGGRKPEVLAASAVYIAARVLGERVSQRALSKAAAISPVALRNRYKELVEKLDLEKVLGVGYASEADEA